MSMIDDQIWLDRFTKHFNHTLLFDILSEVVVNISATVIFIFYMKIFRKKSEDCNIVHLPLKLRIINFISMFADKF